MNKIALTIFGLFIAVNGYARETALIELTEPSSSEHESGLVFYDDDEDASVQKSKKSAKRNKKSGASSQFECGTKRYCKEMSSCAKAKFHLNQCGVSRLDRDGDGKPCENVCR